MSNCHEKSEQVVVVRVPPTEFWLEHPATARARTGSGSAKGMAAGMQTQTVLLAPPSTPRTTLHPMRGLWRSSISHMSLVVYLCILPPSLLVGYPERDGEEDEGDAWHGTKLQGRLGVLSARACNGATAELFRDTPLVIYVLCHLLPKLRFVTDSTGTNPGSYWTVCCQSYSFRGTARLLLLFVTFCQLRS